MAYENFKHIDPDAFHGKELTLDTIIKYEKGELCAVAYDENGNEIDAEIMAALEVEETGKEYMAVMPSAPIRGFEQGEAILLAYDEDENGDPLFEAVSDPEEFEIATNAFEELFASASEIENSSLH